MCVTKPIRCIQGLFFEPKSRLNCRQGHQSFPASSPAFQVKGCIAIAVNVCIAAKIRGSWKHLPRELWDVTSIATKKLKLSTLRRLLTDQPGSKWPPALHLQPLGLLTCSARQRSHVTRCPVTIPGTIHSPLGICPVDSAAPVDVSFVALQALAASSAAQLALRPAAS